MAAAKSDVIKLYKQLMRESQKFTSYNYRSYACRRIRDGFKEHKSESDPESISRLMRKASESLQMIKRQAAISQMYDSKRLVIEQSGTS